MIQMDPRVIWNTHRTSMDLRDNASRQYAEWPPKRPYYGGMGGVVGGTDTLSPISYAAANRSDYQKEAGTNFLPCCSRTDGSMSATCPYPVHDFRFNFQEPIDRYPHLNDYFPGRPSLSGTVTISRSGSMPSATNEWDDESAEDCYTDLAELRPSVNSQGGWWWLYENITRDEKQCCGPFNVKWNYQQERYVPCVTEKDFLESTMALGTSDVSSWSATGEY